MAATANQDEITRLQMLIPRRPVTLRSRADYRRCARWWELEARREYVGVVDEHGMNSSDRSRWYAQNQRWAAEYVQHRRMTWLEIVAEVGNNPGVRRVVKERPSSASSSASPRPSAARGKRKRRTPGSTSANGSAARVLQPNGKSPLALPEPPQDD